MTVVVPPLAMGDLNRRGCVTGKEMCQKPASHLAAAAGSSASSPPPPPLEEAIAAAEASPEIDLRP